MLWKWMSIVKNLEPSRKELQHLEDVEAKGLRCDQRKGRETRGT